MPKSILRSAFLFASLVCPALVVQAQHGFVHTSGPNLVDGNNQPLMLRGTNLGNWFEPEGYMFHFKDGAQSPHEIEDLVYELIGPEKSEAFWRQWRETYITEADMDRLKQMGFNSVRVPIHYKFFDSDNAEGFRLLDRLVQWARKDGIYVIIDLHCAPGGQTGTNIDDSGGYLALPEPRIAGPHHRRLAPYRCALRQRAHGPRLRSAQRAHPQLPPAAPL
jgi:hypothetical protein